MPVPRAGCPSPPARRADGRDALRPGDRGRGRLDHSGPGRSRAPRVSGSDLARTAAPREEWQHHRDRPGAVALCPGRTGGDRRGTASCCATCSPLAASTGGTGGDRRGPAPPVTAARGDDPGRGAGRERWCSLATASCRRPRPARTSASSLRPSAVASARCAAPRPGARLPRRGSLGGARRAHRAGGRAGDRLPATRKLTRQRRCRRCRSPPNDLPETTISPRAAGGRLGPQGRRPPAAPRTGARDCPTGPRGPSAGSGWLVSAARADRRRARPRAAGRTGRAPLGRPGGRAPSGPGFACAVTGRTARRPGAYASGWSVPGWDARIARALSSSSR